MTWNEQNLQHDIGQQPIELGEIVASYNIQAGPSLAAMAIVDGSWFAASYTDGTLDDSTRRTIEYPPQVFTDHPDISDQPPRIILNEALAERASLVKIRFDPDTKPKKSDEDPKISDIQPTDREVKIIGRIGVLNGVVAEDLDRNPYHLAVRGMYTPGYFDGDSIAREHVHHGTGTLELLWVLPDLESFGLNT